MKAAEIVEYGDPNVIRLVDQPLPQSTRGQLRVRVKAGGVGPWDTLVREGRSGVPQTLPLVLGNDIAVSVDATGPDVSGFAVGDDVYRRNTITQLFESKKLIPQVGSVLPLADVHLAHQMLAGAPHTRGKIVLNVSG